MASKNFCHNRPPYVDYMWMRDGTMELHLDPELPVTEVPVLTWVPNRSKRNCVYSTSDLGQADKGCIGCKWREDGNKK